MSILITGAGRRIGRAMAEVFHASGHNLLLHCNQSISETQKLADELNSRRDGSAHVVVLDLACIDQFERFSSQCLQYSDSLEALINNASVFYPTPLPAVTPAQFNDLIDINLRAPYFLIKAFSQHLRGGSIVNIIDIYAEKPLMNFSAYSASKAGLLMLTRSLAVELAPHTRVNGIAPGAILWPDDKTMDSKAIEQVLDAIPSGKIGHPKDIAQAALFLVDHAQAITGQIIPVDGGSSI